MKKNASKKISLAAAVSCMAVASALVACGNDSSSVASVPETPAAAKNTCSFTTDSTSYYKIESVEDGITVVRETRLKGDSLISVSTYKDAPYSMVAAECSEMDGDDVKCEGDKITVVSTGEPEDLELDFGLAMMVQAAECLAIEAGSKTDDADVGESAACYYRYADEEDPGESFEGCMEASGKGAKRVKTLCGQIQALVDAGLTGTDQVRDLDHCSEVKSKALYSCTDDEGVVYNYYVLDDDHVDLIVPDDKEATCKAFIAYENEDE